MTNKSPIGSRWIDINKGDDINPDYRSNLVAEEINRSQSDEMFAATLPLEAKKTRFSVQMNDFAQGRTNNSSGTQALLYVDVWRSYSCAPARRPMYVTLPDEDARPGYEARLNASMHGTSDAASNWE